MTGRRRRRRRRRLRLDHPLHALSGVVVEPLHRMAVGVERELTLEWPRRSLATLGCTPAAKRPWRRRGGGHGSRRRRQPGPPKGLLELVHHVGRQQGVPRGHAEDEPVPASAGPERAPPARPAGRGGVGALGPSRRRRSASVSMRWLRRGTRAPALPPSWLRWCGGTTARTAHDAIVNPRLSPECNYR